MIALNALGRRMYSIALAHGSYQSVRERLAHLHSEVSEAYECVREDALTAHVTAYGKPTGLPSELADVVILAAEIAAHLEIDLDAAVEAKMAYNDVRPWKAR